MLEKVLSKELLFAVLATTLVYSVFTRFKFIALEPSKEQMENVEYHYDDSINL